MLQDKELLAEFWKNEPTREAVRKALEIKLEVIPDFNKTNEEIGENVRALWAAKNMVREAFIEIESQQQIKVEEKQNSAR